MKSTTKIAITELLKDYNDAMDSWDEEVRDDRQPLVDAINNALINDPIDITDTKYEGISLLIAKHGEGESLTNDEYFLLSDYWMSVYNVVKVCPHIFGKGFFMAVINEVDTFRKCSQSRLNKI